MAKTRSCSVVAAAFVALLLSACGGGAQLGDTGNTLGGTTGGTGGGEAPEVAQVRLVVDGSTLPADAIDVADGVNATAIVVDANGVALEGVDVQFSLNPGTGGALTVTRGTTDASGTATAVLTTGGNSTFPREVSIQATAGTVTSAPRLVSVVAPGATAPGQEVADLQLFANARQLFADADTAAEGVVLTAVVTDSAGNVVGGTTVSFSIVQGAPAALQVTRGQTDSSGTATATLTTAGNTAVRTIKVRAAVDTGSGTLTRDFSIPVTARAAGLFATVSSAELPADNSQPVTIIVSARGEDGAPLAGVQINFAVSTGAISSPSATTNNEGQTTPVSVTTGGDPSPRVITVTISSPGIETINVPINVVPLRSVELFASSPTLSSAASDVANGVNLTAVVKDSGQNVVQGGRVDFAISSGTGTLTPVSLTTDASGSAQAVLTTGGNPTNRSITATATIFGRTSSVTVNVVGTRLSIDGPRSIQSGIPSDYIATLVDDSGKGIANRSVSFSATNGAVSPTSASTDSSGKVTVRLTPGSGSSAVVSASALGATGSLEVSVTNDSFVFIPSPDSTVSCSNSKTLPALGDIPLSTDKTVRVLWCRSGAAVAGKPVTFTTTRGGFGTGGNTSVTVNTGAGGIAATNIKAAQAGPVTVLAIGNDTAPDPDSTPFATITGEFVATVPAAVDVQADPTVIGTNQESTIQAVVRDAANNLVKNATVNFTLNDVTGGSLSAASAVTDSQGRASVVYRSSSTTSAQDGVTITAKVAGAAASVNDSAVLTVGGQSLRIVLGTGNELVESADTTRYEVPYTAIVTDSAGNPAPNAELRLTAYPEVFLKGYYTTGPVWVPTVTAVCPNEDANENGIMDPGEDTDGDGILDPANVAAVPSAPELDDDGVASFNIVYPQDRGNWIETFRLTARARASGTEATETVRFPLPISADDATGDGSPPGYYSPFGRLCRCDLDDSQVPVIEFAAEALAVSVSEGSSAMLRITASKPFREAISLPIVAAPAGISDDGSDSASGTDYRLPTAITIPANQTSVNLNLDAIADADDEKDELLNVFLLYPVTCNGVLGTKLISTVTIVNQ